MIDDVSPPSHPAEFVTDSFLLASFLVTQHHNVRVSANGTRCLFHFLHTAELERDVAVFRATPTVGLHALERARRELRCAMQTAMRNDV